MKAAQESVTRKRHTDLMHLIKDLRVNVNRISYFLARSLEPSELIYYHSQIRICAMDISHFHLSIIMTCRQEVALLEHK